MLPKVNSPHRSRVLAVPIRLRRALCVALVSPAPPGWPSGRSAIAAALASQQGDQELQSLPVQGEVPGEIVKSARMGLGQVVDEAQIYGALEGSRLDETDEEVIDAEKPELSLRLLRRLR